jgi:hypothetical protein
MSEDERVFFTGIVVFIGTLIAIGTGVGAVGGC